MSRRRANRKTRDQMAQRMMYQGDPDATMSSLYDNAKAHATIMINQEMSISRHIANGAVRERNRALNKMMDDFPEAREKYQGMSHLRNNWLDWDYGALTKALNADFGTTLPTDEELNESIKRQNVAEYEAASKTIARAGWAGDAIGLGVGFGLSMVDPPNLAIGMAIPGLGPAARMKDAGRAVRYKSIAFRSTAAGVAAEAVMQPVIKGWKNELGVEYTWGDAFANSALGVVAGTTMGVGAYGMGRLLGRLRKQKAHATSVGDTDTADGIDSVIRDVEQAQAEMGNPADVADSPEQADRDIVNRHNQIVDGEDTATVINPDPTDTNPFDAPVETTTTVLRERPSSGPTPENPLKEFVMSSAELAETGDDFQSPYLLADGAVVATQGDHLDYILKHYTDKGGENATYAAFAEDSGAIRASVFFDTDGSYNITLHLHGDQGLTQQQYDTVAKLINAVRSKNKDIKAKVSVGVSAADSPLANPKYQPATMKQLAALIGGRKPKPAPAPEPVKRQNPTTPAKTASAIDEANTKAAQITAQLKRLEDQLQAELKGIDYPGFEADEITIRKKIAEMDAALDKGEPDPKLKQEIDTIGSRIHAHEDKDHTITQLRQSIGNLREESVKLVKQADALIAKENARLAREDKKGEAKTKAAKSPAGKARKVETSKKKKTRAQLIQAIKRLKTKKRKAEGDDERLVEMERQLAEMGKSTKASDAVKKDLEVEVKKAKKVKKTDSPAKKLEALHTRLEKLENRLEEMYDKEADGGRVDDSVVSQLEKTRERVEAEIEKLESPPTVAPGITPAENAARQEPDFNGTDEFKDKIARLDELFESMEEVEPGKWQHKTDIDDGFLSPEEMEQLKYERDMRVVEFEELANTKVGGEPLIIRLKGKDEQIAALEKLAACKKGE